MSFSQTEASVPHPLVRRAQVNGITIQPVCAISGHVQRQEGGSNGRLLPLCQAKHHATPSCSPHPQGHVRGSTTLPAACWDLAPGHETIDNRSHAQRWEKGRRGRKTHWSFPELLGLAFPQQKTTPSALATQREITLGQLGADQPASNTPHQWGQGRWPLRTSASPSAVTFADQEVHHSMAELALQAALRWVLWCQRENTLCLGPGSPN